MNLLRQIAFESKEKYLETIIPVFINKKINDIYEGKDNNYNTVIVNSKDNIFGKRVNVKINRRGVFHLMGSIE